MFEKSVFLTIFLILGLTTGHPTMYKLNENDKLEADLIPVSSTVIPLPIYQVSYGLNVAKGPKGNEHKPETLTLLTVHSKKVLPKEKLKVVLPKSKQQDKE